MGKWNARWWLVLCVVGLIACVEDSEPDSDEEPEQDAMVVDAAPDQAVDMAPDAEPPDMRPLPDMLRPPAPGDPCAEPVDLNAEAMGAGGEQQYQTELGGAPSALQGTCGGNGPEEVVRFVAPAAGRWYFSTQRGTMFDTVLYVQSQCGQTRTELACNDDVPGQGFQSIVAVDLEEGQTIFLVLDTFGRTGGPLTLGFGMAGLSAVGEPCDGVSRVCPDGSVCVGDRMGQTCQEVRERAIGEPCDPRGETGPCVEGAVCYGFRDAICEEVRERMLGEACDPGGELGPCVAGSVCYGFGDEAICEEVRERQEGEPCDPRGGIGPCAEGLDCRRLGMGPDDTFCVEVEVLEEGAICALDGSAGRCEDGTICQAADGMAPVCAAVMSECPADWPIVDLNAAPGGRGWRVDAALALDAVEAPMCGRQAARPANVFSFTAAADGRHTFETLPPAAGEGFDTLVDIRRFCGFTGVESTIICDDDGGAMFYSRADVQLTAGETVYVLVGPAARGSGSYTLEVTGPGAP